MSQTNKTTYSAFFHSSRCTPRSSVAPSAASCLPKLQPPSSSCVPLPPPPPSHGADAPQCLRLAIRQVHSAPSSRSTTSSRRDLRRSQPFAASRRASSPGRTPALGLHLRSSEGCSLWDTLWITSVRFSLKLWAFSSQLSLTRLLLLVSR
jgi:hypothetical protein